MTARHPVQAGTDAVLVGRDAARTTAAADACAPGHWIGDEGTPWEGLATLLAGDRFPALRHLGVQNCGEQNEIAAAMADAPVVAQLASLNLSLGNLGDPGAEALLAGQPLTHLRELDLRHHYMSDAMMLRMRTALEPAGVRVNLTDQQDLGDDDLEECPIGL